MHECPNCQLMCDCDGEDHFNQYASDECVCECWKEEEEFDGD